MAIRVLLADDHALVRQGFRRILEEYPELAMMMQGRIIATLQTMIERIEGLAPRFAG